MSCQDQDMTVELDHIILPVNDLAASVSFYSEILGFTDEGQQPPFSVVRVGPGFTLQLGHGAPKATRISRSR